MAHACWNCNNECYCRGSIDDVIVDKTPNNCKACGCNDMHDYNFECCDDCDLPDACSDFGCAIEAGLKLEEI